MSIPIAIIVSSFIVSIASVIVANILAPTKREPEVEAELIGLYSDAFKNAVETMTKRTESFEKALLATTNVQLDFYRTERVSLLNEIRDSKSSETTVSGSKAPPEKAEKDKNLAKDSKGSDPSSSGKKK